MSRPPQYGRATIELGAELADYVRAIAEREDRTMKVIVRRALELYQAQTADEKKTA